MPGVDQDDVGPLARGERPGHRVQAQRPGPLDGAERQRLPGGARELLMGRGVDQALGQFHDREHVGVAGQRGGVHGQADADPGREQFSRLREPVADQQLAERRQAHRTACLRELGDFRRGGAVGVHHLQVGPEQARAGQRGDLPGRGRRPGGVHGDREAELAGGGHLPLIDPGRHPHGRVAAAGTPAGHAEGEQPAGPCPGLPVPVQRAQPAECPWPGRWGARPSSRRSTGPAARPGPARAARPRRGRARGRCATSRAPW